MSQFEYTPEGCSAARDFLLEKGLWSDEILESFQDFLLGAGYIIDPVGQKIVLADSENRAF
tara:strand:+ start:3272 stop:3454 length:183 start_codon:yes stop_codon:yes gene_type:complete